MPEVANAPAEGGSASVTLGQSDVAFFTQARQQAEQLQAENLRRMLDARAALHHSTLGLLADPDVLAHVLQYCPLPDVQSLGTVCRFFYHLHTRGLVSLRALPPSCAPDLGAVLCMCWFTQHLDLCLRASSVTAGHVLAMAANCPHLLSVDLSMCTRVPEESLLTALRQCHQLAGLGLQGCHQISDDGLAGLVRDVGPRLVDLDVRGCEGVGDSTLGALAQCCPRLRTLRLGYTIRPPNWVKPATQVSDESLINTVY